MIDPEEVSTPVLTALDKIIENHRTNLELLRDVRAVEFTRAYARLRQQRIRANAPTRNPNRAA